MVAISDEKRERNRLRSLKHYYDNKEAYIARTRERYRTSMEFIQEYKATCGCMYCGEKEPVCLDLHHRDPSAKGGNISEVAQKGHTRERLQEEIDKCDVVCSNCHRKLHAGIL